MDKKFDFKFLLIYSVIIFLVLLGLRNIQSFGFRSLLINVVYIVLSLPFLRKSNFSITSSFDSSIKGKDLLLIALFTTLGLYLLSFSIPLFFRILYEKSSDGISVIVPSYSIVGILLLSILTPFAEELFFRHIIGMGLKLKYNQRTGLWISAFAFTIAHLFSDSGLLFIFIYGLFLAFLYLKAKNFFTNVLVHSMTNLLVIFMSPSLLVLLNHVRFRIWLILFLFLMGCVFLIISFLKINNLKNKVR